MGLQVGSVTHQQIAVYEEFVSGLQVGSVTHQQIAVYEEFARNVPGFLPTAQEASQTNAYTMKPAQVSGRNEITIYMPHSLKNDVENKNKSQCCFLIFPDEKMVFLMSKQRYKACLAKLVK